MNQFFLYGHSHWRYLLLLFLIIFILKAIIGIIGKKPWGKFDKITARLLPIAADVQLLQGIIVLVTTEKDLSPFRKFEHPFIMLIAIILLHVGSVFIKKSDNDTKRFKLVLGFYLSSLLLMLLGIWRITTNA
ncbi:MAG: hypothetical protein HRT89_22715 [Lentisphaeria bacterium]|nr:hypothetical protein [Lentisphaeria bacterium]NQZ70873.1 hypothetical protein [Lentisphaeria bacterium]